MTTTMWIIIMALILIGLVLSVALAALRYWVAFGLFLFVYVAGVLMATVQAVKGAP